MNNSQFWTWVDYWECWDFMQDELEDWCDEVLWLICMICGSPVEGCICEDAVPTPTPDEDHQHPSQ